MDKRIFLIGPMAAGKSSVGKKLSALLSLQFLDSDLMIMQQQGCSMYEIFTRFDENYFRKLEAAALKKISALNNIIVATGGGSILSPTTRKLMSACGIVCYLDVSIDQQMQRLQSDNTRPTLPDDTESRFKFLQQKALERQRLYTDIANITVNTSCLTIDATVQQVITLLRGMYAIN